MTRKRYLSAIAVGLCFLLGAAGAAQAQLALVSPNLGPAGYPTFYQDSTGRAVELCQDPANCLFDPIDPANPASVALGVGGETFYWLAEATANLSNGGTALLVLALEAAFDGAGVPAIGQQIVFNRFRVRIDYPQTAVPAPAGNWVIQHPFGPTTIPGAAGLAPVDETVDTGCLAPCDFSLALAGTVTQFLAQADPPPPLGFLGTGVDAPIQAGPGGAAFTVTGPDGVTGTTTLFAVQGKLFAGGVVPVPLTVPRATFSRSATGTGQVDVFATTAPGAEVTVTGTPNFPAGANPLTEGVLGAFFATLPLADASVLPAGVTVTSTVNDPLNPPPTTNSITAPLEDLVTVSQADYIVQNDILLVTAESSDKGAIPPTLTATAFGLQPGGVPLQGGTLIQTGVLAPPADVTVTSTSGGSGSRPVNIVTGNPGTISVTRRPSFTTRRQRLSVNGRITPAVNGARVRIIGPNGLITEAVTSRTGTFRFAGPASLAANDTLTFVSNGGAFLAGQAVNVR